MSRPIVIVNPLSSGIELAPAFKTRGIPAIAVAFKTPNTNGFGMRIREHDFIAIIPHDHPNLIELIKQHNPIAILPGTDDSITLAERLTLALTPQFANDPGKSSHRSHKALMQTALKEANIPHLKTLNTASEDDVTVWLNENELTESPLIIKPPMSAGSDKVFHIPAGGNWKAAFKQVLTEPSKITKKPSETVVVQEQAIGTEFAVGTVSANGHHYLAHLIKYNKRSSRDRDTLFDFVEFIPYQEETLGAMFDYTKQALNALGIRWGAAHTEIMLTANGPRLIESGARMCGGPVVGFAREASGSSQADKLAELYADGDVQTKQFHFKKTVMPVFLKSPATGRITNIETFNDVSYLPTLLNQYIWVKNGDFVPETVDYLTSIGIIALSGNRGEIQLDYKKIREMESKLVVDVKNI